MTRGANDNIDKYNNSIYTVVDNFLTWNHYRKENEMKREGRWFGCSFDNKASFFISYDFVWQFFFQVFSNTRFWDYSHKTTTIDVFLLLLERYDKDVILFIIYATPSIGNGAKSEDKTAKLAAK